VPRLASELHERGGRTDAALATIDSCAGLRGFVWPTRRAD
jgi:hypothetical protein